MQRFFFHIYNDVDTPDDEGLELADVAAAIERGRAEVRVLAAESVRQCGHLVLSHRIEIVDEHEVTVATIRFGDVIAIER